MLPKALKSCPKSNKSPNLVTLFGGARFLPHRDTTMWRTLLQSRSLLGKNSILLAQGETKIGMKENIMTKVGQGMDRLKVDRD